MLSWINIQCFDVSILIQFNCSFNIETEMEDGGQGSLQHVSVDFFYFFLNVREWVIVMIFTGIWLISVFLSFNYKYSFKCSFNFRFNKWIGIGERRSASLQLISVELFWVLELDFVFDKISSQQVTYMKLFWLIHYISL